MKKIKLYTIQDYSVYLKIKKNGFYRTDRRFICSNNFKQAYEWLFEESKKIHKNWKEKRPVWTWLKKPDLRSWKYFQDDRKPKKVKMVLLELLVDENEVVVSDFDTWHCVLNCSLYTESDKEWDDFHEKYGKYDKIPKAGLKILKNSWQRCLNPNPKDHKQGTIEQIREDQIVKVTNFYTYNKIK